MTIAKWDCFEQQFTTGNTYEHPFQEVDLRVSFISPSGSTTTVDGFWDGANIWRVRFSPDEIGKWRFVTSSSDAALNGQSSSFTCTDAGRTMRFSQHGPVQLSEDRHSLTHADGTPFFWLADTAWNGPLLSTTSEWQHYLSERVRQGFTAVQWVATQWRTAPNGDEHGVKAYSGDESRIRLQPEFFQRLDEKVQALNHAGLLSVPVLLWSIWSSPEFDSNNPGATLPEDQAIRLARYMVARWAAYAVVWILPGDGTYQDENAERWKRIGRAVFGDSKHAPVSLHPGGMQWNMEAFGGESWLDIAGYQSGHGDDAGTVDWLTKGPPASDWRRQPSRPVINLEPPYENHIAYQSRKPHDAHSVRRSLYWSLLNAPTAGVTYGGHGVWGWDDGTHAPTAHPGTGVPLPWQQALRMPAAEQLRHLVEFFTSIEWWRLAPAPEVLAAHPGDKSAYRFVSASQNGDMTVIYLPERVELRLRAYALPENPVAVWVDPSTGSRNSAELKRKGDEYRVQPPGDGDWVLVVSATR